MNYAYNIGAAGIIAAMHRQDVASNNLANIQTPGFKPDRAFTIPREAAREEDGLWNLPSNALLERLGAGVLLAPTRTEFTQGTLASSRNPLDVGIEGAGFLTVGGGQNGETRLTRDGRLTQDSRGYLVTVADGHDILDDGGNPIALNPALDVTINSDGTIVQGGTVVAQLGFTDVTDRRSLRKLGDDLFSLPAGSRRQEATGKVVQYTYEESASDPIKAMMAVQAAADLVTTTAKVMQIHDDLMNKAVNTLGRVSA